MIVALADSSDVASPALIETAIFTLLKQRALTSSICPSEAAKLLVGRTGNWRELMQPVRDVARILLKEQRLRVTQGDAELSADQPWAGAIRFRLQLTAKI